jgi:hypothetical protein
MRFFLGQAVFALILARSAWADEGADLGLPTHLTYQEQKQEESRSEFVVDVNLWPILESTTLPTGEHRTAFWPLFHVSTRPQGGVHSWHVLNFLTGPNYHMFLPLYYSVDADLGILPPVFLSGADYWASLPLLSGSWRYADGDETTWVTPLFHVTRKANGDVRNLHAGFYFEGENSWSLPLLLTGSWTGLDGSDTLLITPLFHRTLDIRGEIESLHALFYFQGAGYWALPPLLTWQDRDDAGAGNLWVTPLFHWSTDQHGAFRGAHLGPYFQGTDYWFLLPLAGSGTYDDGSSTTWITPLYHVARNKDGTVKNFHVGPYVEGDDWWTIPPLLLAGWHDAGGNAHMTMGWIFCAESDKVGLKSASLCPIFLWERDDSWCVFPLLSGQNTHSDHSQTTWITPLFHLETDAKGEVDAFHIGPYWEGRDYWTVPPLLSWHVNYSENVATTWLLAPIFHWTSDKNGAESAHLFPAAFWKRDDYLWVPPLLSASWKAENGNQILWITPLFHETRNKDGDLLDVHVGPYLQGEDYWGIPPLLSGGWHHPGGGETTWLTPLFHVTTEAGGDIESLHVGPYFQGRNYWAIPPLLSWHRHYADGVDATWLTPAFHVTTDPAGDLKSAHLFPAVFYERDDYFVVPPALSGSWREKDGGHTTWVTPLFHVTEDKDGDLESLHVLPAWFWKRDDYWVVPPLLSGGGAHADGAQTTWITPIVHWTEDRTSDLESLHVFPFVFWKRDDYWTAPLLLSGGVTRPDGSSRRWISPFYHDEYAADGSLRSRHMLNYFDGADYHHFVPVFWDWKGANQVRHTMVLPPLFVQTEEANGDVTGSLPWPLISWRHGKELDTSLGMELRPFVYQTGGEQVEFNFLWRLFSVLREEDSTRVMVGPFWHSTRPNVPDAMTKFQILGGLFARDCNYETQRYRYRLLWVIPFAATPMAP